MRPLAEKALPGELGQGFRQIHFASPVQPFMVIMPTKARQRKTPSDDEVINEKIKVESCTGINSNVLHPFSHQCFYLEDEVESSFIHAKPIHTNITVSPFSKESSEQNYRGFVNLALLFLGANLVRLIIENFLKYGILLSIPGRYIPVSDLGYGFVMVSLLCTHLGVVLLIERLALIKKAGHFVQLLAISNISLMLLIAPLIIWRHMYHPCVSGLVLSFVLIFTMKIISYHSVNYELRKSFHSNGPQAYPDCPYPENLSVKNFAYFLAAPTLCYQPVYPRTPRVRRTFLIKRLFELASALFAMYVIIEQFASPTVKNSMVHLEDLNLLGIAERMLKLSFSCLYVWLLGFFAIFQSLLNATAEMLRFGDRSFYHAWWNANTLEEYWRLWNAPVHLWLKRHIYIPLRARGYSTQQAQIAIFALSAFFHEYLVSIPTHSIQIWAFAAMLFQIPLISLTNKYLKMFPGSSAGNFFFWITLCVFGQPMCVLLYYRAWIKTQSL